MKVETDKLSGAQLDWAVAKAQGHDVALSSGTGLVIIRRNNVIDYFNPSVSWSWAGPIIENELFAIQHVDHSKVGRVIWQATGHIHLAYGPTCLVAAMRCYVKMILGYEVEVPDVLQ